MKFQVKYRDGASRIGEIHIESDIITTPNILFIESNRIKAPSFSDIILSSIKKNHSKPYIYFNDDLLKINSDFYFDIKDKELKNVYVQNLEITEKEKNNSIFAVKYALQIFEKTHNFSYFITKARENIGYQKPLYIPSIANPINISLLCYLGLDFFDSTAAIIAARNNILFFSHGLFKKDELFELCCNCYSCAKITKKPSEMNFKEILNHNYFSIYNEIKIVRNAIRNGTLRELVENRVKASPNLSSILRILDQDYFKFFENRAPINRNNILISTTKDSLFRPEIKRFQERLINRYIKPKSAKILVLLPCSAKKPYSFSKSHKLFLERINNSKNPSIFHEMIVTSPLGLVPRELELIYPASSYDISVTGYWDNDEKFMIRNLLKLYLNQNNYDKVIIHLPKTMQEFITDLFKKPRVSCINTPTSKESLNELSKILSNEIDGYEIVNSKIRQYENVLSIASYQFGKEIAEKLMENTEIKGKYPFHKIIQNNKQLGMITKDRGFISLTIDGAKKIFKSSNYWVEISDDFVLKGSVFAPGVINADKSIRIGDEVVVQKKKQLCGVGVAMMNGAEMKESNFGEAIKIRHLA